MHSEAAALSASERTAALSIALMLTVPFLLPFDHPPIQSFYQEWIAAALGASAFVLLAASTPGNRIAIPSVILLPLALIALIVAHALTGRLVFVQQGVLGGLYLAWASILVIVGFRLRDRLGSENFAALVAWSLLAGASASAVVGLMQFLDWTPAGWLLPARGGRLQGNLGQPNQFADYLFLGLTSAIFLLSSGRLPRLAGGAALLSIVTVVSFSGSRATLLYFAFLLAGVLLLRLRHSGHVFTRAVWWTGACVTLFVAVQAIGMLLSDLPGVTADPLASRLAETGDGNVRLRIWHSALLMAAQHPWIGVGFQGFAWHHFLLAPSLSPETQPLATANAHNLILHLLAEFGVGAVLLCVVAAAAWLIAQRRTGVSPGVASIWAALGVLLLHSALEYPLWYAYFLGLFSLLVGASWPRSWSISLGRAGRAATVGVASGALLALSLLWIDYRDLERLSRPADPEQAKAVAELRAKIVAVYKRSLLPDFLVFALASGAAVDTDQLDAKIALNTMALRLLPTPETAFRQALFLALRGQQAAAERAWDQAVAAYPGRAPEIIRVIESDDRNRFSLLLEYARQKTGKSP